MQVGYRKVSRITTDVGCPRQWKLTMKAKDKRNLLSKLLYPNKNEIDFIKSHILKITLSAGYDIKEEVNFARLSVISGDINEIIDGKIIYDKIKTKYVGFDLNKKYYGYDLLNILNDYIDMLMKQD